MLKKLLLAFLIIAALASLTACKTVETAVADSGLKFTSHGEPINIGSNLFFKSIELFVSAEELAESELLPLEYSKYTESGGWETVSVRDKVAPYDDTFFESKAVIMFTYVMGDSRPCDVDKITVDGEVIKIYMVSRYDYYNSTFMCVVSYWIFIIELDKTDIADAKSVEFGGFRDIVTYDKLFS